MKRLSMLAVIFALVLAPLALVMAEAMPAEFEKINLDLEYHKRMVGIIENYLRDRAKIPADYQAAADKEFMRRVKNEKPKTPAPKVAPQPAGKTETAPQKKSSTFQRY